MDNIFENKFTDQSYMVREYFIPGIEKFHNKNQELIKREAVNIIQSARKYKSQNAFEKLILKEINTSNNYPNEFTK